MSKVLQEGLVGHSCPSREEIVGMDDKGREAVSVARRLELLLPHVDRVIVQDVEQGVILDRRDRKLESPSDEIRHHGATTTALRSEMRQVRPRPLLRELAGRV